MHHFWTKLAFAQFRQDDFHGEHLPWHFEFRGDHDLQIKPLGHTQESIDCNADDAGIIQGYLQDTKYGREIE
jgi:hypothetical protein